MCVSIFSVTVSPATAVEVKEEREGADHKVTVRPGPQHRQLPSDTEASLTTNNNVSYFYNSSHISKNDNHNIYLPASEPVLSRREILIISLTSIVAVILVVIAAVVVIWKVGEHS